MENRLSMTRLLQDEDVDALVADCSTRNEFTSCVRALAKTGYLIPLVVLQFCYEGN
jgi:hypothetical protein